MQCPPKTVSGRRHAAALATIGLLILIAYANSFAAGLPFDNGPIILNDARVHAVSLPHLKEILLRGYWTAGFESGLYRPLTTLSFLLNYAVLNNADRPDGYHALNLLLHLLNAFLLYCLVFDLAGRYWPALWAAALWAVHPITTEAVTNIVGRADELAAFGVLAALVCYIRATREAGKTRQKWLTRMMLAAFVAVFSKENGIMLAALVPLYDFTFRIPRGSSLRSIANSFRQFFRQGYLDLAIPILAMLGARWFVIGHAGLTEIPFADNPLSTAGWITRLATAIRVVGKEMWLLVWPRTLSIDYSYHQIPLLTWNHFQWRDLAAAAAILGLLAAAILCYRFRPTGFFLLGFSALTLLPATNLLVITGTILAERLLYLPAAGFAAAVALGADFVARRVGLRPVVVTALVGAVAVAYIVRTQRRNRDWIDNESLFASAVEASPDSFKSHMGLGNAWLVKDPQFLTGERAIGQAEQAVAIVSGIPDDQAPTTAYVLLSAVYWARGDSLARKDSDGNPLPDPMLAPWYRKSLDAALRGEAVDRAQNERHRRAELARGTPADHIGLVGLPDAYVNLGTAYLRLGDPEHALEAFLYERRLTPLAPLSYLNLALAYQAVKQPEQAATALLETPTVQPTEDQLNRLAKIYGGLDGGSCALTGRGESRAINRDCPIVHRDLCSGYVDLEQALRRAKMDPVADRVQAEKENVCR